MKTLYRGLMASLMILLLTSVSVSASRIQVNENISYDYQNNTFSIVQSAGAGETELSVSLLKGEWNVDNISSAQSSDFYYVGQQTGEQYSEFGEIGIKYDNNKIEPGVYTLVTSGDGVDVEATKIVIGNAINADGSFSEHVHSGLESSSSVEFGTVASTLRMYGEGEYAYVCIGNFNYTTTGKMGFMFQRQTSDGKVQKAYTELGSLKTPLNNIASMSEGTKIQVGLQMNFVPEDVEFVAIPYVSAQ